MFGDIKFNGDRPYYLQIKDYIKELILKGMLRGDDKLPSSRELSKLLSVSRNTVILSYELLEDEGYIYPLKGKGVYVSTVKNDFISNWQIKWENRVTTYGKKAGELDVVKSEIKWERGMISFKSIAPDENLFDIEELKRSFLNRITIEGSKILNYGYARGYKPLVEYIEHYMFSKGINTNGKDILITNGFTEGFDIILSALVSNGEEILCEDPTHNTAIKIMKLHNLNIKGVSLDQNGINIDMLEKTLKESNIKLAYLVPSYHNPTGIVMSPDKRIEVYKIFQKYGVPIIEDGFNEELRYSGNHVAPISALCGEGNSMIYTGSFSKILFPGLRIGWILADKMLISVLESIKRSRNIHTSFLDQALLYEYMSGGNFDRYLKKARKYYRAKYEWAIECAHKFIPHKKIYGEGGLHIFLETNKINSRNLLKECYNRGVIFTPGDIFYVENGGENTLRLGFSRVSKNEIEEGFKIIGEVVRDLEVLE